MSAVGRYRKLYPRIWRHPNFTTLRPSVRELALYLLTGPQTSAIGLFHFSVATAAEDLGVTVETIRKGLVDVGVGFGWQFDSSARVFFIPSWWNWNRPENENVLTGNLKALSEIPPSSLVDAFARNLETLPEALHPGFIEGCRKRLSKHSPIQEQEHKHLSGKQEHEHRGRGVDAPVAGPQPSRDEKCGADEERLLPVAREVLRVTNPDSPIEHLLDTFWSIKPQACTKAIATKLLNMALAEKRGERPLMRAGGR